jgi:hypothetical protein
MSNDNDNANLKAILEASWANKPAKMRTAFRQRKRAEIIKATAVCCLDAARDEYTEITYGELAWLVNTKGKEPAGGTNAEVAPVADGFTKAWPFGMEADLAERKVRRNGVPADFGAIKSIWDVLCTLAHNHPRITHRDALLPPHIEPGAVPVRMTKLREMLAPLGVTIPPATRGLGYLLAEGCWVKRQRARPRPQRRSLS